MKRKRFEECAQNLTISYGRGQGVLGFASAAGSSHYKMWAGLNPRTDFALGGVRLYESSYCYFKAYAGARNLEYN